MTKAADHMSLRYDEGCLAAHALNLVGDRWALLVVRELMFAPKRFQMLRVGLPGISASVLTGRLAQLAAAGVVRHDERLGIYALTEEGRGLLPVLEAFCRWALTVPGHDPSRFISPSALMISMGVTLGGDCSAQRASVAGFDFGREAFEAGIGEGHLQVRSVARPNADFVLAGTGNELAAAVYGATPLPVLVASGRVGFEGDIEAASDFLSLFELRRRT